MISSIASITALIVAANALAVPGWGPHHWPGSGGYNSWNLKQLTSLVVFGDSYSDDSRLGYFIENNGSAPPVGWVDPVVCLSKLKHCMLVLIIYPELCCCRWRPNLG